ncbi:hypothetical protein B0H34DRAFT_691767 [Crassisporium funariophilum]|nr:hypothetical protein B0H34DRAFT_691767 [Crassisporium funariophilum]
MQCVEAISTTSLPTVPRPGSSTPEPLPEFPYLSALNQSEPTASDTSSDHTAPTQSNPPHTFRHFVLQQST